MRFIIRKDGARVLQNAIQAVREISLDENTVVTIGPYRKSRSHEQNALLWKWYGEIRNHLAETTGEQYQNEDIHEFMKDKFMDRKAITIGNDVRIVAGSTAKLNIADMSEYLERLDIYCADELGLVLTHPI